MAYRPAGTAVDPVTGTTYQTQAHEDPRAMAAEKAQVMRQNLSVPAGAHLVYPGGGDPTAAGYQAPHLEANQSGFDPAMLGIDLVTGPWSLAFNAINSAANGKLDPLSLALSVGSRFLPGLNQMSGLERFLMNQGIGQVRRMVTPTPQGRTHGR